MSNINIPNRDQWERMNGYLSNIANSLGTQVDRSDWTAIHDAVTLGIAPTVFPIGTQFTVSHLDYGDMLFDVVAHDHYEGINAMYGNNVKHSMTLLSHHAYFSAPFNSREAFYYADSALSAGTYNFTLPDSMDKWEAGTYQFSLSSSLPKGGQLAISGDASTALTSLKVEYYNNQQATSATYSFTITKGSGGTNLGTLGIDLNHVARVSYGSNNYAESDIRQLLNSAKNTGSVWNPQTKYDRPPSWVNSMRGFVQGFQANPVATTFLIALSRYYVKLPCVANQVYESPDSSIAVGSEYILEKDMFYIPSQKEIMGYSSYVSDQCKLFPYYEGATDIDYIKYRDGVKTSYWTRSCDNKVQIDSPGKVNYINSDGKIYRDSPTSERGIMIAFNIC